MPADIKNKSNHVKFICNNKPINIFTKGSIDIPIPDVPEEDLIARVDCARVDIAITK